MNGLPYYRAFPRDFIEGTVGMSFEEKAAYRLVLDLIYMQNGRLPDDARYISGLLGCSVRKWNALRETLIEKGKIYAKDGIISNLRADKELETTETLREKKRENASGPRKNRDLKKRPLSDTDTDINNPPTPPDGGNVPPPDGKPVEPSDPPKKDPPVEDPWKFFTRFWEAYPSEGKVSASEDRARFAFGPAAVKLGAERVARSAENYARAVKDANTKPVSIFRFLTVSEGLIERYGAAAGGGGRSAESWRAVVRLYADKGLWSVPGSGPPGSRDCRVPPEILAEFGYGDAKPPLKVVGGAA
ncbi:MAG: DUF1376 domain-containing protein [Alphaproteobacteria bacterium]|nr:DUF1376 domain-containing protein [Alphaproteobacteria bacterium]